MDDEHAGSAGSLAPHGRGEREPDEREFDALLQTHLPQLRAFVRSRLGPVLRARESSLDVVQSVCRELLTERERFDYRGDERFRAWIFTAARNKLHERHRRLASRKRDIARECGAVDPAGHLAPLPTPSQDAIGDETAAAICVALEALRTDHREVLTMARVLRLPHRVIAEVLQRSEEATRKLLARATLELGRELRRRGVDVAGRGEP